MKKFDKESTCLYSYSYDESNMVLTLEFQNTYKYDYFSVPKSVFNELMTSSSRGCAFNEYIRGKFSFQRIA